MSNPFRPSGVEVAIRESLVEGSSRTGTTLDIDPIITKDGHRVTMTDIGDICFGKIDEGTNSEEIISWTGMTDNTTYYTLTGVVWGYNFYNATGDVDNNKKRHDSGARLIITNDDHFLSEQYANKDAAVSVDGDWTISGEWQFPAGGDADAPKSGTSYSEPTDDLEFTSKKYVDDIAIAGAAKATDTTYGIAKLSSAAADPTAPVVLNNEEVSANGGNPDGVDKVVKANTDGKIDSDYIELADDPGLQFDTNGLEVKLKDNGGLKKDSDGVSMVGKNTVVMTAGETINGATTPVPVYQDSSDGEVYACDGDDVDKVNFIGFAITDGTDGNNITVQISGIVSGFTGLTVGENYYLSTTAGSITTTQPNYNRSIGIAISATDILIINNNKFSYAETDDTMIGISTDTLFKTIPIPAKLLDNNSVVKISGLIRALNSNSSYPGNWNGFIKYGGSTIGSFGGGGNLSNGSYRYIAFEIILQGKNSTSSQRSYIKYSYSSGGSSANSSYYDISVDSTAQQDLTFYGTKTEGTVTVGLSQILIETIK